MKRFSSYILIACLVLALLAGCAPQATEKSEATEAAKAEVTATTAETKAGTEAETEAQTEAESQPEAEVKAESEGTHTLVDHAGDTVVVPNKVTRIVIDQIPILSTYMAYFGGKAPYIVGFSGSFKTSISKTVLKDIAPELMDNQYTVYDQSDINIEEIVKLKPDVILYNANNKKHAEILKASGIPCVGFATIGGTSMADPIERYEEWLNLLEAVFNEEGKSDAFVAAGDKIVADVEARIATVAEDQRPSGLILWKYSDGIPQVSGQGTFGTFWMKRLGVKDFATEAKGFAQVSVEQVYKWNPDILYLDGPGLLPLTTEDVLENKVEGIDFSTLKAVKDKRVYGSTLGMWNWFTPNPDAPIVYAWLASRTYPEAFADYPLEDTIKAYYKEWYGYDVKDAELAEMLSY